MTEQELSRKLADEHDWHWHDDGNAFLCMKCGKLYDRTRGDPYPPESKCEVKRVKGAGRSR